MKESLCWNFIINFNRLPRAVKSRKEVFLGLSGTSVSLHQLMRIMNLGELVCMYLSYVKLRCVENIPLHDTEMDKHQ